MTTIAPTKTGAPVQRSDAARANHILSLVSTVSLPILLVLVVVIATATTPSFLNFDNIRGILINTAVIGIVAVGMTPITLSGNFVSLAVHQSTMLATVLFIALQGAGLAWWVAALVALLLLLAVGFGQGLIVAAGLNPMITTLAAGSIIFGVTTWATGGKVVSAPGADFSWIALKSFLGLPLPIYIFIAFTILITVFVDRTVTGRRITLTGANRAAARLSGISARQATIWAYLILSLGATVAGMIVAGQVGQATSSDLATLTESVIAAVLVGGTAIQGGHGSPVRSAVGALIIAIFTNAMVLHNFHHGVRLAVMGALVLVVVAVLQVLRKRAGQ